jgi:hypothetical protein
MSRATSICTQAFKELVKVKIELIHEENEAKDWVAG